MKNKLLLTTAIVTYVSVATAGIAFAQGDQNQYAENNPNVTQPPVQNQYVGPSATPTTAPGYQYQYKASPSPRAYNEQERNQGEETQNQLRAGEDRTDPAGVHANRLQLRFSNYAEKLSGIANRIQAFVDRYAEQGRNVDQAQKTMEQARQQLHQAQTLSDQSVTAFTSIDPAMYQFQRQVAFGASQVAQEAQEAYRHALRFMVQAVQELRQAE